MYLVIYFKVTAHNEISAEFFYSAILSTMLSDDHAIYRVLTVLLVFRKLCIVFQERIVCQSVIDFTFADILTELINIEQ